MQTMITLGESIFSTFLARVECFGGFWRRIRAECKSVFEARPEAKCEIPSVEDKSPPSCSKHTLKWPAGGWRRRSAQAKPK